MFIPLLFVKSLVFALMLVVFPMGISELHAQQNSFTLQSPAFQHNQLIPLPHACLKGGGQNISPALSWSNAPAGTKSFALIVTDPDAPGGTRDHWILFNLPPNTKDLPQEISALPEGTRRGLNSREIPAYAGPCPPSGTHRYFFDLYALDTTLDLPDGVTKQKILPAIEGHVLAKSTIIGTYTFRG